MTRASLTALSGALLLVCAIALAGPQQAVVQSEATGQEQTAKKPAETSAEAAAAPRSTRKSADKSSGKSADGPTDGSTDQSTPAPAGKPSGKTTVDRLELDTTAITGNRELPKVLYIVPWKKSDLGDLSGRPAHSLLDEVLTPVDREVFRRQTDYFAALSPGAPAGAGEEGPQTKPPAPPAAKPQQN